MTGTQERRTLRWLSDKFLGSERFLALAAKTRREYERQSKKIMDYPLKSGKFGDVDLYDFTPGVFRQYLDRADHKPMANSDLAYISTVWSWGYERDMAPANPCKGVRRHKTPPRTRYVTHDEFAAVKASAPAYIQVAMELAYRCRMRWVEVFRLEWADVSDKGILLKRVKGSKTQLILSSPELVAALDQAKALPGAKSLKYVIHDTAGQPYLYDTFSSAWGRIATKTGVSFHFHDLKAKGVTDFDGNKLLASGHKSASMLAVYDRGIDEVDAT